LIEAKTTIQLALNDPDNIPSEESDENDSSSSSSEEDFEEKMARQDEE